jgi:nucleoside-diphosphate-sugar epimerase|tara:strand:- start:2 stop:673 length:672 start_codon:yes stop_codon:yes gene_type:complete
MKVLILGDGILGSEIKKQTGWDMMSRKLTNFDINSSDLRDLSTYNTVVNCIAHTDTYSPGKIKHLEVNYNFVKKLSDFCLNRGLKLVHISTEFVYANSNSLTSETDKPIPDNTWYAKSKLLADNYIELTNDNALICRELHKPYPFPYDEVWKVKTSGDTVNNIAALIIKLINKDVTGIYNVGTGEKWLKELAPNAKEIEPPEYVPKDTSMNLNKLNKLLNETI